MLRLSRVLSIRQGIGSKYPMMHSDVQAPWTYALRQYYSCCTHCTYGRGTEKASNAAPLCGVAFKISWKWVKASPMPRWTCD